MLRLLIAILLLKWGLIPEQNTMSTCVEISEAVAEELGRPELVEDWNAEDYTPTSKFLRLINRAHRDLDRWHKSDNPLRVSEIAVVQGDYALSAPDDLRFVNRIDLEDSAGNIVPDGGLKLRTLAWLRDRYGELFSQVDEGEPAFWARADDDTYAVEPEDAVELITNGGFDEDLAGWEVQGGSPEVVDGACVNAATAAIQQEITVPRDGLYTFSMDVIKSGIGVWQFQIIDTAASVTIVSFRYGDALPEETFTTTAELSLGTYVLFMSWDGTIDNVSLSIPAVDADLIIMPPADQAYTARLYGGFYADAMVDDTDVTWWSDKYPEILELAIKRRVAVDMNRNDTEAKSYETEIRVALNDIELDAAFEDLNSARLAERRFGSRP